MDTKTNHTNTPTGSTPDLNLPDHGRISITAKGVAFIRAATDIPFARDVSELAHCAEELQQKFASKIDLSPAELGLLTIHLEARYKSLVSAIQRSGVRQVLELASGISMRGLAMTRRDSELIYVETDLDDLTREKLHMLQDIQARHGISTPAGFHVQAANALHWDELEAAAAFFNRSEALAIVHEGFLMYLAPGEQSTLAQNIIRLLKTFGGVWITPDFAPLDGNRSIIPGIGSKLSNEMLDAVKNLTGRDFHETGLHDEAAIEAFCRENGFQATVHDQIDGSYALTSAKNPAVTDAMLDAMQKKLKIWELRLETQATAARP